MKRNPTDSIVDETVKIKINNYYLADDAPISSIEVYIYLLNILKDKIIYRNIVSNKKTKHLLDMREGYIISDSNNLEVLIYALDNDIITIGNAFINMCGYHKLEFVKYLSSFDNISEISKYMGLERASLFYKKVETIKYLLNKYTYDKDALSKFLYNFLTSVCFNPKNIEYLEIVDLFVKNGADIHYNHDDVLHLR